MEEKSFFVNLKSESSKGLGYKIGLIVNELQARTKRKKIIGEQKYDSAIDKPKIRSLSKEEIEIKIKRWANNKGLKVSKCLTIMKQNNWELTVKQWKKLMTDSLLIVNPNLFLISLTKEPHERSWINSNGKKKKASDYGNILESVNDKVKLNKEYESIIKTYWG